MLNQWWFKLYTRPFLQKVLQYFLAALFIDFVLTMSDYAYAGFIYFLPLAALLLKFSPGSFRENIEFHKMSVPFGELRKAFLTDVLITASSFHVLFILMVTISSYKGGFFSSKTSQFIWNLTPAMFFYFGLILFIGISWVCFIAVDKKYIFAGTKHRTFWQSVFFVGPICVLGFVQMLAGIWWFSVELSYTFLLGAAMTASIFFFLRSIFHKGVSHASLWKWLQYFALGNFTMASIFGLSLLIGRNDVFDKNLKLDQRLNSFTFSGIFAPKLDAVTFRLIEPQLDYMDRSRVYRKVAFDPSELGLKFFLDNNREEDRLLAFLDEGKPSIDFLMSLYSHLSTHPDYWKKVTSAEQVRHFAFHRWPKNKILPDKYLAEKKKADDFAELRKQKRSMASGR